MIMTTYIFEQMTADQAANFTGSDTLIFETANAQPSDIGVINSGNGLDLTTLTYGGKSLVFAGPAISQASSGGGIEFTSAFLAGTDQTLILGTAGDDSIHFTNTSGDIWYGFGGTDHLDASGTTGPVVIYGGGADTIIGGSGADHLYAFDQAQDPNHNGVSINGGGGNDYIHGSAGNDTLTAGGAGNDRIFGGGGNDLITLGTGNSTVNGNLGDDTIHGGIGNDSIRGGQGNDLIFGGTGNDILMGDLGNDTLVAGHGIDVMTGGPGSDLFVFGSGEAGFTTTGALAYFTDTVTDFAHGTDHLAIANGVGLGTANVVHAQAGIQLSSLAAAQTYAQQLLDAHVQGSGGAEVAAIEVGSDAYLFYSSTGLDGHTIDSIIKLAGVDASTIDSTDFTTFL
jgi:serralysin